ncbi:MAG: hypothetical protein ACK4VZ_15915 [Paracoccaceae bacterium]
MKLTISADCSTITMKKTKRSVTCPAADLPKWIKIYTTLHNRKAG